MKSVQLAKLIHDVEKFEFSEAYTYQLQFGRASECVFSEIPENFYSILRQILYFSGTTAHIKEQNYENADFNIMSEFTTKMTS